MLTPGTREAGPARAASRAPGRDPRAVAAVCGAGDKHALLDAEDGEATRAAEARRDDVIALSALDGGGVDTLVAAIAARLTAGHQRYTITLDAGDGAGAAWLHQHGEVLDQAIEGDRAVYEVRMAPRDHERFLTR